MVVVQSAAENLAAQRAGVNAPVRGSGHAAPVSRSRADWRRLNAARAIFVRAFAWLACLTSLVLAVSAVTAAEALAKKRHAFVVGVAAYPKASGLRRLKAPVHDSLAMRDALQALRQGYEVTLLTDKEVADKAAFEQALQAFLQRVQEGDEVIFYFSGHGNHIASKGNIFLLPSAKSEVAFIKDLSNAESRELESGGQRTRRYEQWLGEVAVSERDVEAAILARRPDVLIIIADACRTLVAGTKGATPLYGGIQLPTETARGTFRLYSAGVGQISHDSPEPIVSLESATGKTAASAARRGQRRAKTDDDDDDDDDDKGSKSKRTNSLFTKVLLSEIGVPGNPLEVLALNVKRAVRDYSIKLGAPQIPDFVANSLNADFYFTSFDARDQRDQICQSASAEIERLRGALAAGSLGREVLELKRYELARCGPAIAKQIERFLKLEALGAVAVGIGAQARQQRPDPESPLQFCEVVATSPHDPNRTVEVTDDRLQGLTLRAMSGDVDRGAILADLDKVRTACEAALVQNVRVPRLYYLTGRVHQTIASVSEDTALRQNALAKASGYFHYASELGYAAAFNDLAMMHKSGDFFAIKGNSAAQQPPNREKALELLQRGANLNHTIAQYNLGMAFLNGDLGVRVDPDGSKLEDQTQRYAKAFEHLSKAAERAFVPALIETAKLLYAGRGVPENEKRAVDLLQIAASRGSWEAMYWIGYFYRHGRSQDHSRAIIWFARAAESGDARAQEQLAQMMTDGSGLPAPQPESAGRYWRLAAEAGLRVPQGRRADLIRDGSVPFRPVIAGRPDRGASEIRQLYLSAFARGNPRAGLQLARLYRTGFPKDDPSQAIPQSRDYAVRYLWETIERVNQAAPDSPDADPKVRAWAAFDLMKIYEEEAAGGIGRSSVITEDQIRQLRADYGDGSKVHWVNIDFLKPELRCGDAVLQPQDRWVMVWNWTRPEPPTSSQFDWLERRFGCRERVHRIAKSAGKDPPDSDKIGFTKPLRDAIQREQTAWLKEADKKGGKSRTFIDRMIAKVDGGKRR